MQYSNEQATEVFTRKEFGVDDKVLFKLWQEYMSARTNGDTPAEAAKKVMQRGVGYNQICYFMAFTLEIIAVEFFKKEEKNGE